MAVRAFWPKYRAGSQTRALAWRSGDIRKPGSMPEKLPAKPTLPWLVQITIRIV